MRGRVTKRRTTAEWATAFSAWRTSGLSVAAFCSRARINESTFRWRLWREKRRSVAGGPGSLQPAFLPIHVSLGPPVAPAVSTHAPFEVVLDCGSRIVVRGDFDPVILRKLLDVVEGSR